MGLVRKIQMGLVFSATIGLLVPLDAMARSPESASQMQDITLQVGGTLNGKLLNEAGKPVAGQNVMVLSKNEVVARVVSGVDGSFSVRGVRPGVHVIRVNGSQDAYRLWTAAAAPPAAKSGILLISDGQQVVRGQHALGLSDHKTMLLEAAVIGAAGVIGGVIGYNARKAS